MGYYIETQNPRAKAGQLLAEFPEIQKTDAPVFDYTGKTVNVCVVENGPFDACAIAYDVNELDAFRVDDGRRKTWLVVPNVTLHRLVMMGRAPASVLSRVLAPT